MEIEVFFPCTTEVDELAEASNESDLDSAMILNGVRLQIPGAFGSMHTFVAIAQQKIIREASASRMYYTAMPTRRCNT